MKINSFIYNKKHWINTSQSNTDGLLYSKFCLARNLSSYDFPNKLTKREKDEVANKILTTIFNINVLGYKNIIYFKDLNNTEKSILEERNITFRDLHNSDDLIVISNENESINLLINGFEHLTIFYQFSNTQIRENLNNFNVLKHILDTKLNFSQSPQFGFLTSDLKLVGSGFKLYSFLHMPAISMISRIEKQHKLTYNENFKLERCKYSDIYQLLNSVTLGMSEDEIITKLKKNLKKIIKIENNTRKDFIYNQKNYIEDRVYRAYGILKNCRMISFREASFHLSILQLGIYLKMINDLPNDMIKKFLYILQDYHIFVLRNNAKDRSYFNKKKELTESDYIKNELYRANMLRNYLKNGDLTNV